MNLYLHVLIHIPWCLLNIYGVLNEAVGSSNYRITASNGRKLTTGVRKSWATQFRAVAPKLCVSPVRNLLNVTLPAPKISRWMPVLLLLFTYLFISLFV